MPSMMPPEELASHHDYRDPISVKKENEQNIQDHPFFGMYHDEKDRVVKKMEELREGRDYAL